MLKSAFIFGLPHSNWLALSRDGRSSEHEGGLGKSQGRTFKDGRCGDQRKGMRAQRGLASRSVFVGVCVCTCEVLPEPEAVA